MSTPLPSWPYPRWIAHRGAGKLAPENTLAAFRLGAQHGYRMAECDAKLSADGVVGDVATVLLREDGSWRDIGFNERASGLNPAELARVPRRFCVVADPSRAAAVVGALRAGTTTDLVIDDGTARAVVDRL